MKLFEMNKEINIYAAVCVAALTGFTGCATDALEGNEVPQDMEQAKTIVAYIDQPATTRACITSDLEGQTQVPVLWSPSDVLGVFTASDNNVQYANSNLLSNTEVATFTTSASVTGNPVCAYYPYSASAGTDKTALNGEIPQTQKMNLVTGMIPGDYKIGEHASTTSSGSQFRFTHLFSPIRVKFDGTGTALANDCLIEIDLTVTRNGAAVPVSGSFTFNATDGSYTKVSTSNKVTFDWPTHPVMNVANHGYATIFPEIKTGDNLTFTIRTSAHTATLTVTAKVDFEPNTVYTFPLTLSNFNASMSVDERTNVTTGTFTAATYNVDGLPQSISLIPINADGPGSDGTKSISQKIAEKGWDIIGFAEDFEYHTELTSALGDYTFGTHRGSISSASSNNTDGLCFATRNASCSFANESWTKFTSSASAVPRSSVSQMRPKFTFPM